MRFFFFFLGEPRFYTKIGFFMKKIFTPSVTYVAIYSRADNQWVSVPDSNNRTTRGGDIPSGCALPWIGVSVWVGCSLLSLDGWSGQTRSSLYRWIGIDSNGALPDPTPTHPAHHLRKCVVKSWVMVKWPLVNNFLTSKCKTLHPPALCGIVNTETTLYAKIGYWQRVWGSISASIILATKCVE